MEYSRLPEPERRGTTSGLRHSAGDDSGARLDEPHLFLDADSASAYPQSATAVTFRAMNTPKRVGLADVPTDGLKTLLRQLHRDELDFPLGPAGVACLGLQHHSEDILGHLRGLDKEAVRAVLVAVLAERL